MKAYLQDYIFDGLELFLVFKLLAEHGLLDLLIQQLSELAQGLAALVDLGAVLVTFDL